MLNQKGNTFIYIVIGLTLVLVAGMGYYFYSKNNSITPNALPHTIDTSSPSPLSRVSPSIATLSAQPLTLEVDFSGMTLLPVNAEKNYPIYYYPKDYFQDSEQYEIPVTAYKVSNDSSDGDKIHKMLQELNWSYTITVKNYTFRSIAADGACGSIFGYLKHENGLLRQIVIDTIYNPCGLPDGSEHYNPDGKDGTYISISDIVPISKIISSYPKP